MVSQVLSFVTPLSLLTVLVLPDSGHGASLLLASLPPVLSQSPSASCQSELPKAHLIPLLPHLRAAMAPHCLQSEV